MPNPKLTTGERFERAVTIMAKLRSPDGCPWDREQTFDSIKPYTVEETYEVLEAIDNRDWGELSGELGDLLLQVLFYAQMAKEEATFCIDDVLDRLSNKLVSRHPHVFGDGHAKTSADVLRSWEAAKAGERKNRTSSTPPDGDERSVLAEISGAMPALTEAHKLGSKAARFGFDWPTIGGLVEKLKEETRELEECLGQVPSSEDPFSACNACRHCDFGNSRSDAKPSRRRAGRLVFRAGEYRPAPVARLRIYSQEIEPEVPAAISSHGK